MSSLSVRFFAWRLPQSGLRSAYHAQEDPKLRQRIVQDLSHRRSPTTIPKLEPYLGDSSIDVRIETVKALDDIGGPRSLDPLIKALNDVDPEVQIRATDGLVNFYVPGYLKTGLTASIKRVGTSIKGHFTDTNDLVIDTFVQVRPDVIEVLGKGAKGGASKDARANAARAIGILRGKAAIPDLIEAIRSKDDEVIYESLVALQKIRDPAAGPQIAFLLHDLKPRSRAPPSRPSACCRTAVLFRKFATLSTARVMPQSGGRR